MFSHSEDGVALLDLRIEQSEVAGTSWYIGHRHNPWHSGYAHLSVGVMHVVLDGLRLPTEAMR
jgi:hypothetical protein